MANFEITLRDDVRLVRVTVKGNLDKTAVLEIPANARALSNKYGYNVLYDLRESRLQVDLPAVLADPRNIIAEKKDPGARSARVACLVKPGPDFEAWLASEDVLQGMYFPVLVFTHEEQALDWLFASTPGDAR